MWGAALLSTALSLSFPTPPSGAAQDASTLPHALQQMVEEERAFAARAAVAGVKQAFLEFLSDSAIGFAQGEAGPAKDQIRRNPDPPKDLQLLWEPRFGDVAASGDLGYLTGPSRTILPSRNKGQPQHSVYASVWKRQPDGTFRVVLDVGVPTPSAAPFAAGFQRALPAGRFTGDYDETTPPLGAADRVMNSALRTSPTQAYRGRLATDGRFHRPNQLPIVGERNILRYVANQPRWASSEAIFAEAARSGDLGYTWGSYGIAARGTAKPQRGFYARVWVRARDGQWRIALDVLQPQ